MAEKKNRSGGPDEKDDASASHAREPKGGRPGPADEGGTGGMATRENAPEIAEDPKD
ncbi:hypothetical protein [Rhodococcus sp. (in: high G+C Gram-positive bacteria)]|uniref:hypothetical protein n=1 Tax=Rhodococcus sp. TaxID=1831 RepID=UPI00388F4DC1